MTRARDTDPRRPAPAQARGFAFSEALVVMALLALLALVVLPHLAVPAETRVRVIARQVVADLRLAQRLAIARRADYAVEFSPSTPPYAQYTLRRAAGGAEPDFPKDIDPQVTVAGTVQFVFRPDGTAAGDGAITLSSSGATASVQVLGATGRVSMSGP